jgi:hypothetical protein
VPRMSAPGTFPTCQSAGPVSSGYGERRPSNGGAASPYEEGPVVCTGFFPWTSRLRSRKEDLPRVPWDRGNADELLRTIEQRSKLPTGSPERDFLRAICPCCYAAHHVRGLLIAIYAIEVGFGSRIDRVY